MALKESKEAAESLYARFLSSFSKTGSLSNEVVDVVKEATLQRSCEF